MAAAPGFRQRLDVAPRGTGDLYVCIRRFPTPPSPEAFQIVKGDQSDDDWLCVALQDVSAGVTVARAAKRILDAVNKFPWHP